jgi:hypothetical protein
MLIKANLMKIFFCVLALGLCAFSKLSYADWTFGVNVGGPEHHHDDHHSYRWHDHPHYGYRTHFLPDGYFTIWAGGRRYFYSDGLYYDYVGNGEYVIVNPPIGAFVSSIPPDFQSVDINGRIYYTDGGIYYILTQHHGYKVVPQPVVYSPQQVIVTEPQVTTVVTTQAPETQDAFPINVPNNSGGYTSVVVKRSGNGYVGPQGEFYATFPSVAQLKAMYGK